MGRHGGGINKATLAVVATLLLGAGVLVAASTPASAAGCTGGVINFVAHEDDDLLFLSPDLVRSIHGGTCVRTVFLTAGDAGDGQTYWSGRETGIRIAYSLMAGVSNNWTQTDAGVAGHPISLYTLNAATNVSVAFMHLPDGNIDGSGFSATGFQSLQKLWQFTIPSINAVDGSSSYTRDVLTSTLTQLMTTSQAATINTQDFVGAFGDSDHADHHAMAYFTKLAHQSYARQHTIYSYADYDNWGRSQNVSGQDLTDKSNAFYAYGANDSGVCNSAASCAGSEYGTWLGRQYVLASEQGGSSSSPVLSLDSTSLDLGNVTVGQSGARTIAVSNSGTAALSVSSISAPGAPFTTTGLAAGASIAAGASVSLTVTFAPTSAVTSTKTFTIATNGGTATISLAGTGTSTAGGGGGTVPSPIAGGWQLNGNAAIAGTSLRLTNTTTDVAGSAFWPTPVSSSSLSIGFDATISGGTGADGMALVLASSSAPATSIGDSGGGLGFAGISGTAVTLDTYQNWGSADPSANFLGVATGYSGSTDNLTYVATATTIPALRTATRHVDVTVSGGTLVVKVAGTQYISRGVTLGSTVLVGFTAGNGGLTDTHAVSNVTISTGAAAPAPNVSYSATSLAFGSSTIGQPVTRPITLTNSGTAPAQVTALVAPAAPFALSGALANGATIPVGGSIAGTVTFTPTAAVTSSGSLSVTTNDGTGAHVITLTGTGQAAAAGILTTSATAVAFGTITVGTPSSKTVTVSNTGTAPLSVTTISGPATPFTSTGLTSGATIPAGASVTLTVTFTPTAAVASTGSITLTTTGGNATIGLTGTGQAAAAGILTTSATAVAFGTITVGTPSSKTVTVSNTGTAPLSVTTISGPATPFTSTGLTSGATIPAGASVTLTVTFTPTAAVASTGSITLTTTGGNATIGLTGTGQTAGGATTIPSPLSGTGWQFNGSTLVNGTSLDLTPATANKLGTAITTSTVNTANLTVDFDVFIGNGTSGDGLTFALLPTTVATTAVGTNGGCLGWGGLGGVAVALDTYQNWNASWSAPIDPSNNFVGIATSANTSNQNLVWAATSTAVPTLRNTTRHVKITTAAGHLKVSIDGTPYLDTTTTLPATARLAYTAATGGNYDRHAISNITITAA